MSQRHAPATERNRQFILDVLNEALPPEGTVLEIASGTGQHAVYFADALAPRVWQPSDIAPENLSSIAAWRAAQMSEYLRAPLTLDVRSVPWPVERELPTPAISAIVNINMIHISPWDCCEALLAGAERILPQGGVLFLYGPFKRGGAHTSASNEAFDARLRLQDPAWGVRNLDSVVALAEGHGFTVATITEMPANNLAVVFKRSD